MQMSLVCVMMNTSHIKALSNKERSRHHERKKTGYKSQDNLTNLLQLSVLSFFRI